MNIFRDDRGQYTVIDNRGVRALFDTLRNAISFIRMCNHEPVFVLD